MRECYKWVREAIAGKPREELDMEWEWISLVPICLLSILTLPLLLLLHHHQRNRLDKKLPPGPKGWPVIGNIFDLVGGKLPPHQILANLGRKHGPVMWLQLGAQSTIVVSTAAAATEMFKKHDHSFSDRTVPETMKSCSYYEGSIGIAQYGPRWRMLRRLVVTELFTQKQVNATADIRRKCVDELIKWVGCESMKQKQGGIDVARLVFLAFFNSISNLVLSRDLVDPNSEKGAEFFNTAKSLVYWAGKPNASDFFPFLRWFDPQGLRRRVDRHLWRATKIIEEFIQERYQSLCAGLKNRKDFLDVLLEFKGNGKEEPAQLSDIVISSLILEIFLAATDSSTSTIEWVMTELLRNPAMMQKVQEELDRVVGKHRRLEEKDIEHLQYLKAVVKEALRLYPPGPLLVPRKAIEDVEFMGYLIPKGTQVLVHAWTIGRDPTVWDDPLTFKPERFIDTDVDYYGQHLKFIPFGAGRRICAGIPLAEPMLHYILGSMLHSFDWVLDMPASNLDMGERLGVTLSKDVPLKAQPKDRLLLQGHIL